MRRRISQRGMTIMELMLAVFLSSFIMLVLGDIMVKMISYYQRSTARNQMDTDARNTLSTMTRFLQQGKANTTVISTPSTSCPPYSRIDFALAQDTATLYAFYYVCGASGQPAGPRQVAMQLTKGTQAFAPQTLANNVTSLSFTGDALDPGYVNITLRLDAPVGLGRTESVIYANQTVHMVSSQ